MCIAIHVHNIFNRTYVLCFRSRYEIGTSQSANMPHKPLGDLFELCAYNFMFRRTVFKFLTGFDLRMMTIGKVVAMSGGNLIYIERFFNYNSYL